MKPRTQLRFLSIALFALWGRAGAETLPPFFVSPALLGPAPTPAAAPAVSDPAPAVVTDKQALKPAPTPAAATSRSAAKAADKPVPPARVSRGVPVAVAPAPVQALKPGTTVITGDKVSGLQDVDAVAEGAAASCMCEAIIKAFNDSVPAFYSAEDVQRGYIEGKSRSNTEERFPLMSLTIVGVRANSYQSSFDLARAAAALKKQCKLMCGSNYRLEEEHCFCFPPAGNSN